ncbi:Fanconi anemia group G protein [Bufo gargarizans]|uniref:Fanconi anemia group G protein n=1 Tax=Bufo gargarizans TaxID=30331 RepID=UPI001CF0F2EF|nr:Fanconi anemia group G protein [Bufo gargarizans]XP_044132193.1 Fanconi anemia group G protein [Bufo gargarizans]
MEVDGETGEGDCRTWWTQENNIIIRTWQDSETCPDSHTRRQRRQQCHSDLIHLLQKIQGLPPAPHTLPLELTVLYNMVIVHSNISAGGFLAEHSVQVQDALNRVMEALVLGDTIGTGLWVKILAADLSLEMTSALHRLAGLQCALWLSNGQLRDAGELLSLLGRTPDVHKCSHKEGDLLLLIKAWNVSPEEPETILTVQTTKHVKDVLYNAAALLQGVIAMNASDFPRAVDFLQEAASSLCSSRVLAEIYTCLGYSFYKMVKPQASLQCWRLALRMDFQCLSALYHSSVLYRDMGDTESELEALALLHTALENPSEDDSCRKMSFPFRTELIVRTSVLSSFIHTPDTCEVKYLMARQCLQNGRTEQAVGHYLELISALQDGSQPQGLCSSPAPLPRIPVIYLEASAALLENKRFADAITVCLEVLNTLRHLTTGDISIDHEKAESMSEQLNCVLWAASAHLLQGEALSMLGDHRESVADFTRCINLLTKIHCGDSGSVELTEYKVWRILKAAALLGRGHQFQQMGEDRTALMNAKLSLQIAPAFPGVTLCLLDALRRLGRKKEAACEWRKFQSNKEILHQQWEDIKGDLPLYLSIISRKADSMDASLVKELEYYVQNE